MLNAYALAEIHAYLKRTGRHPGWSVEVDDTHRPGSYLLKHGRIPVITFGTIPTPKPDENRWAAFYCAIADFDFPTVWDHGLYATPALAIADMLQHAVPGGYAAGEP